MHVGAHLVPLHCNAGAVGTEHRVRRVVRVPLRVIAQGGYHARLISAGSVAPRGAEQPALAPGIGGHLSPVVPQPLHRGPAGEHCLLPLALWGRRLAPHPLDVGQGPPQAGGGQLQPEVVPRLQQDALRLHQPLPHRPVGGLAEVAPLGMLLVGPAGHQCDPQICDGGASEHPQVLTLQQVGEDQPLPVQVQLVGGAGGPYPQAAATLPGLQQQVDLGVVA